MYSILKVRTIDTLNNTPRSVNMPLFNLSLTPSHGNFGGKPLEVVLNGEVQSTIDANFSQIALLRLGCSVNSLHVKANVSVGHSGFVCRFVIGKGRVGTMPTVASDAAVVRLLALGPSIAAAMGDSGPLDLGYAVAT